MIYINIIYINGIERDAGRDRIRKRIRVYPYLTLCHAYIISRKVSAYLGSRLRNDTAFIIVKLEIIREVNSAK